MSLKCALTKKKNADNLLFSSINHMEVRKIITSEKGKHTIKLLLLMTKKNINQKSKCTL